MVSLLYLFRVCFFTGTLFTVVSFLLGQLFDFADLDGEFDLDGDLPGLTVSPLKPIVIVTFVTVFGGAGLMATQAGLVAAAAGATALAAAALVAGCIYRCVVVPLYRAQNTSSVSQQDLLGQTALISLPIRAGRFGKISYVVNGNSYTAPAKSADGNDLERGEEVVIVRLDRNVYYVKRRGKNKSA